MANSDHPVMLIVLDGWGYSDAHEYNAIRHASTPVWDALWSARPHMLIDCSGVAVGLPDRQMGNSEVGHMHIGAGRLIDQDFSRIGKAIASGEFRHNAAIGAACATAAANGRAAHIMGLLSPGGVHSHEDHLLALIESATAAGVGTIYLHAFLDGRDTPPCSAAASLERLDQFCRQHGNARIASIIGRYFAMDRNQNWERTAIAHELIVNGIGTHTAATARAALDAAYGRGETDEFVTATVISDTHGEHHRIEDGDIVLFANFRADRARQITSALTAPDPAPCQRSRHPQFAAFVCMTDYGEQFDLPVAFASFDLKNTFGAVIAGHGLQQLRIAETEKYAHVTFFFNGGEEKEFPGEERILVASPDVATYDLQPEMSAAEVTTRLCDALASERYDAIICNYANADMVGHTGNFDAAVRCVEVLDTCLGRVLECAEAHGVDVLITADHGNVEQMRAGDGSHTPHTAHTSNLVPLVYVGREAHFAPHGSLADLAPTMLRLMALEVPAEMTGQPLLTLGDSTQDAA